MNYLTKILENDSGFYGIDVSNEISLFEYGLLICEDNGTIEICYGISKTGTRYTEFSTATVDEDFPKEQLEDLADEGFYDWLGTTKEKYQEQAPILHILSDLHGYYTHLNLFGDPGATMEVTDI